MSTDLFSRDGIHISTFAGPVRKNNAPRTRVQITNTNNPPGHNDVLTMTLAEWAALVAGVRELGTSISHNRS